MTARRVALIHATPVAIEPIATAFKSFWPEAVTTNLLEDSLSLDLAAQGDLNAAMHQRFCELTSYSVRTGADAVLFTCSAFGPCIETARRIVEVPVLKPNEAMIEAALALGNRLALVATFEPSLPAMKAELEDAARQAGRKIELSIHAVPAALKALQAGDGAGHDELIAQTAKSIGPVDAVILAQFSMARAEAAVARRVESRILTSPRSAVERLKSTLNV